jgi:SNF2 family DNA or RNA helicase
MKFIPYDYQQYAIDYIIRNKESGIFLDMGLGKTVITLTAIEELMYNSFEVKRVLVVAPLRVARDTWSGECDKWDHLKHIKMSLILGDERERIRAINRNADIYVINRENLAWLIDHYGKSFPYDMVVLDELSSFKDPSSKRFRKMKSVRQFVKRIVGLTGTPAPNGLLDLWPQIYLLDMGKRLGRYISAYRNEYFVPDKRNGQVIYSYKPRPYAEREIYKKINDLCVSMKAADYIKMPDRVDNFIEVKMSDNEKRLYDRLERDTLLPFSDGDIDAVNAAALATKLLQMANGAVYDENKIVKHIHNKKLEALEDLYEAANGKPVLIFYMYKHDRDRIKALIGQDARELDSARDIADWNAGRIKAAIAHPASTGHGLNLQSGGSTIIWFGLTWSLELYQQANARLWRQGQKETVIVHHLVTKDTIDEQVMKVLQKKEKGQSALMNAVKARLGPK